jgi:PAS domain S-box-containing protein
MSLTLAHARRFARLVAWILAIGGSAALISLALDWQWATHPLNSWPSLTFIGAGGLLIAAMGLDALAREDAGSLRFAAATGLLVAIFGTVTLLRGDVFPASFQATLPTTMVLGVIGLTFSIAAFGRRAIAQVALGAGGFVLLALGIASVMVRAMGLFSILGERGFATAPVQVSVAAILIGAALILIVWTGDPIDGAFPDWIPVGVVLAGVVSTGFLWQSLTVRETSAVERLVSQALNGEAAALRREVDAIARLLRQAAAWTARDPASDNRPRRLLELVRDVPGLQALALLDSTGSPAAIVPTAASSGQLITTLRAAPGASVTVPVRYIEVPNEHGRFVVHAPVCVGNSCLGGAAGLVTAEGLFGRTSGERTRAFVFETSPAGSVSSQLEYRQSIPLDFGDVHWILTARPTAGTLAATRSALPELVLVLGLAMTAILHITLMLGDSAWRNARTVERLRLTSALDRATDAIWEWDTQSGKMERSAQLWRHLGYDERNLQQTLQEWTELIHPDDRDAVTEKLLKHAFDNHDSFEAEYRVVAYDGEWHTVADRGRAVERDLGGRARRILGITADITAGRRAEQAMREIDALTTMGRVAAKVAHEINNPLAGIQSAFMLLKEAIPIDHPDYHYTGAIEREIARIAGVTRQLYETYRPEQDEGIGTSVGTLIRDATAFISQVNRSAGVTIELVIENVPSVLPLSGAVLRQIVYNLVQNAVDATPSGGVVRVAAEVQNRELVLRISDQGPGVPAELHARMFDSYGGRHSSSRESMSLGLAMVSRSVSSAGGTLGIDDAPEGGACFVVRLPLPKQGATP